MSSLAGQPGTGEADAGLRAERGPIIDLSAIDLTATVATRDDIGELIPHRHEMALLDRIVWHNDETSNGVASITVKGDEFWVRGHFPERPMMPGVLMVEAGAQLACYLFNKWAGSTSIAAFLRIEDAAFRQSITVGDEMFVLCREVKRSKRRFASEIQGILGDQICFSATIVGMRIAPGS